MPASAISERVYRFWFFHLRISLKKLFELRTRFISSVSSAWRAIKVFGRFLRSHGRSQSTAGSDFDARRSVRVPRCVFQSSAELSAPLRWKPRRFKACSAVSSAGFALSKFLHPSRSSRRSFLRRLPSRSCRAPCGIISGRVSSSLRNSKASDAETIPHLRP